MYIGKGGGSVSRKTVMAEKRDYYEALGLTKGASDDEIKKAFRKKAKQYHPDIHPGDKEAEERFKEVNEAYSVLSDPQKKAKYDQFGHAAFDPAAGGAGGGFGGFGGFGGAGFDFGDIFDSFFGGNTRSANPNAPRKGQDIEVNVTISFDEAASGVDKEISYYRTEKCDTCQGSGAKDPNAVTKCSMCGGSGRINVRQNMGFAQYTTVKECDACHGTGKIVKEPCSKCGGKGTNRKQHRISVKIPAGIDDGQAISVGGAGNAGSNGGPNGNVIVNISVQHHELFERQGSDVICKLPLTFAQAALGAEIEIPTIDGRVKYNVPAGTQTDTVIRLKGKGMPIIRSSNRGDQYVKFYIDVPRHLNEKQKDLLRKFGEISGDSFENSKNFFDRVKKKFK